MLQTIAIRDCIIAVGFLQQSLPNLVLLLVVTMAPIINRWAYDCRMRSIETNYYFEEEDETNHEHPTQIKFINISTVPSANTLSIYNEILMYIMQSKFVHLFLLLLSGSKMKMMMIYHHQHIKSNEKKKKNSDKK